MRPRICVSIIPRTIEEWKALNKKAIQRRVDFIETRLDRLSRFAELKMMDPRIEVPTIAANRRINDGGEFKGSEEERFQRLIDAAHAGFHYVDIEDSTKDLREKMELIKSVGAKIIVSHHNLKSTPNLIELNEILKRISTHKPDICKIVTTATSILDNLVILDFLHDSSRDFKIISFAMGKKGKISRIASPIFGAYFTIASIERGAETASGQLTIDELKTIYEKMNLD